MNRTPIPIWLMALLFIAAVAMSTQTHAVDRVEKTNKNAQTESGGFTFFGWSDQHIKTDGNADHVMPFVHAMNKLAGTAYPESIGGKVAQPAFVFGAGDVTEWPTNAAMRTYDDIVKNKLKIKAYDVLGNHDDGGKSPSQTMIRWAIKRHGALSFTFEHGGVHFIAVWSKFDAEGKPFQPMTKKSLDHVRKELAKLPRGAPAVIVTHLCYDAMTNRDELIEAIGDANVIMILGGHYHKAVVHRYKGRNWVQLPSPKSDWTHITVLRITSDRLIAIPYDFKAKTWVTDKNKMLDVKIKGPTAKRTARPTAKPNAKTAPQTDSQSANTKEPKRQSLFNGKNLDNFKAIGSAKWRVEDGVIVGGQDGDPKRSGVLMTTRSFKDFDLQLSFMIDEHGKYNSGVYLRNAPGKASRRGYQVNIGRGAAGEYVGLYLNKWLSKGDEHDKIRKPLKWNKLRIRAIGGHIQVWLNDQKIVDYHDPNPAAHLIASGTLAFQTYGAQGHAGWVKFKDISIAELNPKSN